MAKKFGPTCSTLLFPGDGLVLRRLSEVSFDNRKMDQGEGMSGGRGTIDFLP